MEFEDLCLRPASGSVDIDAVRAWLDTQRHVLRDPRGGDRWYIAATPRRKLALEKRTARPDAFWIGVIVYVYPDRVGIHACADKDELARVFEFVRWLVGDAAWTAAVDRVPPEPVGDPRRLFPDKLPAPDTLVDDPTVSPVMDGTLVTWNVHRDDEFRWLAIHSSGEWRYEGGGRALRGRLSERALAAFGEALQAIDLAGPGPPDELDPLTPVSIDIETRDDTDNTYLVAANPPPSYRPIASMLTRWITSLESLRPDASVDVLEVEA
jgi:hypothetical protein